MLAFSLHHKKALLLQKNRAPERQIRKLAMWSSRTSYVNDIARKRQLKSTSASAGCYEAPTDFGCRFSGNSPNEINIAIVGTHEVNINAS